MNFSRPFSAPSSPNSSSEFLIFFSYPSVRETLFILGHTTPAPSVRGSDDEEDSVDEEHELQELGLKK